MNITETQIEKLVKQMIDIPPRYINKVRIYSVTSSEGMHTHKRKDNFIVFFGRQKYFLRVLDIDISVFYKTIYNKPIKIRYFNHIGWVSIEKYLFLDKSKEMFSLPRNSMLQLITENFDISDTTMRVQSESDKLIMQEVYFLEREVLSNYYLDSVCLSQISLIFHKLKKVNIATRSCFSQFNYDNKYLFLKSNTNIVYLDYSGICKSYFYFLEPFCFLIDSYISKTGSTTNINSNNLERDTKKLLAYYKQDSSISHLTNLFTTKEFIIFLFLLKSVYLEESGKFDLSGIIRVLSNTFDTDNFQDMESTVVIMSQQDQQTNKLQEDILTVEVSNKKKLIRIVYSKSLSIYRNSIPLKYRQKIKNIIMNTANY